MSRDTDRSEFDRSENRRHFIYQISAILHANPSDQRKSQRWTNLAT